MVDPPDQLPVGGLGSQAGVVELCQLRTAITADTEISLFFHVSLFDYFPSIKIQIINGLPNISQLLFSPITRTFPTELPVTPLYA